MAAMEIDQVPIAASERVWHTPVNKAFRAMALPFLVRILDIPLSKLDAYKKLFDKHPELNQHVRFVRIIDDYVLDWLAEHNFCVDIPPSNRQWLQLRDFLKGRWPAARFDITSGVRSIAGVAEALEQSDILQNMVAMRWIADHTKLLEDIVNEEVNQALRDEYAYQWSTVFELIRSVTEDQQDYDVKLVSLQIEQKQVETPEQDWVTQRLWQTLRDIPSVDIHTLNIKVSDGVSDSPNEHVPFQRKWPKLRHLSLNVGQDRFEDEPREEEDMIVDIDVDSWISEHPCLEHIDILSWWSIGPLSLENEFPYLTAISLIGCKPGPVGAFLLRHGHKLIELELPTFAKYGGVTAVIKPGLVLPKLRILRALPRVVAALINGRYAPQLAHIELRWTEEYEELMLEEWIYPDSEAACSITCLDIDLFFGCIPAVVEELSSTPYFPRCFPFLVELALAGPSVFGESGGQDDNPVFIFERLWDILQDLEPLPSLRALRLEEGKGEPLRPSEPIEIEAPRAPRKLEYLAWVAPTFNQTQYFRVVHKPVQHVQSRFEVLQLPPTLLILQRLPASFRAHITKEGEWIQSSRSRREHNIFDHTITPPRLLPQP
ncbi:hypothetical protein OC846_001089 [Tilletia horrida]|uniref:Uncharacterized protein n=1 Tax=Tilletia horrida TaxID=155126 RepID=A0AAN6JWA0_9BASI|nr:hypothetical protein OC846_001089 [Tilletia horrida]KAK0569336.1 hypothetical protein OC861_001050 [Tilletia horrida]